MHAGMRAWLLKQAHLWVPLALQALGDAGAAGHVYAGNVDLHIREGLGQAVQRQRNLLHACACMKVSPAVPALCLAQARHAPMQSMRGSTKWLVDGLRHTSCQAAEQACRAEWYKSRRTRRPPSRCWLLPCHPSVCKSAAGHAGVSAQRRAAVQCVRAVIVQPAFRSFSASTERQLAVACCWPLLPDCKMAGHRHAVQKLLDSRLGAA